ncbi:MAG: amidophosphoribosyltransferase [Bacillota bacterium]|nr:amidophosphoribosyltransferase [Bacillota bacterium]
MYNGIVLPEDKLREECGIFGIYGGENQGLSRITYYGLYALQHRGQESAGIAVSSGGRIRHYKQMGLVSEVFDDEILEDLEGGIACGHVRYSTTGDSHIINAQPLVVRYRNGNIALAHNGNLVNAGVLRKQLENEGVIFQTTIDSEVIANLIARLDKGDIVDAVRETMKMIEGAYALVIMTGDKLIGARDPYGIRPLSLGKKDGSYLLSSESCAFDTVGARLIRDVEPGEIMVIDGAGPRSYHADIPGSDRLCIFEFIYFGRPDSIMGGKNIYMARKRSGTVLFREHPARADIVISVPDSGTAAAIGYSEASGIPFVEGLVKNRYVGRTFIQPKQRLREIGVALKLNVLEDIVRGKKVVMVDDSIVRGTTSRKLVQMIKNAGAIEVHLRVSSPPVQYPCYFGIDTPSRRELVGANYSVEDIRRMIGADSLGYLSLQGLKEAVGGDLAYCDACFSGNYPMAVPEEGDKYILQK